MPAIDIHFHAIPPAFVDAVRRGELAEVLEMDGDGRLTFHAPPGTAVEPGLALRPRVYDAALIRAAMDRMRLDTAAVSSPPEFFLYWAAPDAGLRLARTVNDGYAEWARAHPAQLSPLATIPLQDPEAAAAELRRAVGVLGLRGAAVCSHVNGTSLDDPRFEPVWSAAAALGVPIFLHPQNHGDLSRLQDFHLWNAAGFPFETALTAARLILSGTLARHPGLKLVLAHGGGYLPYQLGRLDHAWHARATLQEACPEPPSAYLHQIWCDSLTHDGAALGFLVQRFGEDQVVLGTDHPFDMGDTDPLGALRRAGLPPAVERKIAGETLGRLLRL